MFNQTTEPIKICLDGDWSMGGVAERFPLLARHLSTVSDFQSGDEFQTSESHSLPELDLTGINALDACGCQLLALFVRNLRQRGVTPRLTNIPDAFRSKIHFLGFDREFSLSH